jgi:hypothetical protein
MVLHFYFYFFEKIMKQENCDDDDFAEIERDGVAE